MPLSIRDALAITPSSSARERTIDITTVGAKTGRPRRIEVWFYRSDGEIYLTSSPARRSWYANIVHNPDFTFHLTHGVRADLRARGDAVSNPEWRERVLRSVVDDLNQPSNPAGIHQPVEPLAEWVDRSPLVHVTFAEGVLR